MTLATTSSVWRSTGGDQTRTATAGSMVMAAPFYIANTAATSNVVTSSATGAPPVILPAGAVVTEVIVSTGAGAGNSTANIGFTPIIGVGPGQTTTLGTNVPTGFVSAGNVSARTVFTVANGGASLGNVANATNLVVVTSTQGAANAVAGAVTGRIIYFVADTGAENV